MSLSIYCTLDEVVKQLRADAQTGKGSTKPHAAHPVIAPRSTSETNKNGHREPAEAL